MFQLSYLNRNRGVVQPLFEAGGLGLTVRFKQINQLVDLSLDIPRRAEMIVTPRLMELGMLLADDFCQTGKPVDQQSKIMVDPNHLTIIDPLLPRENGMSFYLLNILATEENHR